MKRVVWLFLVCACMANQLFAAVVLDTDFSVVNVNIDGYAVNTDTERFRDWSESTPAYSGAVANGTVIYAGVHITADAGVRGPGGYVGANAQFGALFARPAPRDDVTTNSVTQVFYLWDSTDFLTSGFQVFDNTSDSVLSMTTKSFSGTGGLRFVIRDGSTYYVASQTTLNGGQIATATLSGDTAGLQWASFNPADFDLFDNNDANLGFGSVSFAPMTFTNVTGIGVIGNAASAGYTQIVMSDFTAKLVDTPTLPPLEIATVVDADFTPSGHVNLSLSPNTATNRFRAWSDSVPAYNNDAAKSLVIYAGVQITAESGATGGGGVVGIYTDPFNSLFARPSNAAINSQTQVLYLWDSNDFLAAGITVFDDSADAVLSVTSENFTGQSGGMRFVIRDGSTYYVANQTTVNIGQSDTTATLAGDAAGLQWAPFDPDNFNLFDDDDTNLGFGSVSFAPMTFNNVTGVGLLANAVSTINAQVVISDFQATLTNGGKGSSEVPLTVHGMFTDNMILQRGTNVAVYGTAGAGEAVTVDFAGQTRLATADTNGNWKVLLDPMAASTTPRALTVSKPDSDDLTFSNILVGDVWVISGQSNMDRDFSTYVIAQQEIIGVANDQIRIFRSDNSKGKLTPQTDFVVHPSYDGSWQIAEESYLMSFSPAGYFMAKRLNEELNVPIGIVQAGLGATNIESWLPSWLVASEQAYEFMIGDQWSSNVMDKDEIDAGDEMARRGTSGLYNYVVAPIHGFTFKGFAWCQGESSSRRPYIYRKQMQDLITSWRQDFSMTDAPFLVVEIAPYGGYNYERAAWLRHAQAQALKLPNAGFVSTVDIGEYVDIHPQAKEAVGDRLAYLSLEMDGHPYKGIAPRYSSVVTNGSSIEISFDNVTTQLTTHEVRMNHYKNQPIGQGSNVYVVAASSLEGFEICGADQVFVDADAMVISSNQVSVSAPGVTDPVAVRYAWENFPLANLTHEGGPVIAPFRTDDFVSPFDPPVFNTPVLTESSAGIGMLYSADMSAIDPNGDPVTYSVVSFDGPATDWLTMDPNTGAISGTPTVEGSYHWVVAAKDMAFSDANSFNKVYADIYINAVMITKPTNLVDRTDEAGAIITSQHTDSPDGSAAELFDNDVNTKYMTTNHSSWVQHQFADKNKYTLKWYTVTSAMDAPVVRGDNLIQNPSLEDGGVTPDSWGLGGSGVWPGALANTGSASLQVTNYVTGTTSQTIPLTVGKTYDLSVQINSTGWMAGNVVFDTTDKYDNAPDSCQFVVSSDNGGWTKYSGSFTATNTSVQLRMFVNNQFQGTSYFDDVSLKTTLDAEEMDPASWTLSGSNDGTSWTVIDRRTGVLFGGRGETLEFDVLDNTTAYEYYKLDASNGNGSVLQIAEIELFGDADEEGGGENSPYQTIWTTVVPGVDSGTGLLDDYDNDGRNNLYEYALNGDPEDNQSLGNDPAFIKAGQAFIYTHLQRNDDSLLSYIVQNTTNLVNGSWEDTDSAPIGTNITGSAYDVVTNRILATESQTYIRLKIEGE